MKSLVVLAFCLASAAAVLDSVWDQLHGYGVGGGEYKFNSLEPLGIEIWKSLARTGWTGGRLMGDTGLDDDVHFSKYRNLCKPPYAPSFFWKILCPK